MMSLPLPLDQELGELPLLPIEPPLLLELPFPIGDGLGFGPGAELGAELGDGFLRDSRNRSVDVENELKTISGRQARIRDIEHNELLTIATTELLTRLMKQTIVIHVAIDL
jgi:hypothetical protein